MGANRSRRGRVREADPVRDPGIEDEGGGVRLSDDDDARLTSLAEMDSETAIVSVGVVAYFRRAAEY